MLGALWHRASTRQQRRSKRESRRAPICRRRYLSRDILHLTNLAEKKECATNATALSQMVKSKVGCTPGFIIGRGAGQSRLRLYEQAYSRNPHLQPVEERSQSLANLYMLSYGVPTSREVACPSSKRPLSVRAKGMWKARLRRPPPLFPYETP